MLHRITIKPIHVHWLETFYLFCGVNDQFRRRLGSQRQKRHCAKNAVTVLFKKLGHNINAYTIG